MKLCSFSDLPSLCCESGRTEICWRQYQQLQVGYSSGKGERAMGGLWHHWHHHYGHQHHYLMCFYLVHVTSHWEVELNRLYLDVIPHSNLWVKYPTEEREREKPFWISTSPCPSQPIIQPILSFLSFFSLFFDHLISGMRLVTISSIDQLYYFCTLLYLCGILWCACMVSSFFAFNKPASPEINYWRSDCQRGSHLIVRMDNITPWYQVKW